MDWDNSDTFAAHVEGKLGSFNNTIPAQAMATYNYTDGEKRNHWLEYATMVSDLRTVCPLQSLARYVSDFNENVYSYVATQKRSGKLGGIADATSDVAAIFGVYEPADDDESSFVRNMQDMFYNFVKEGKLPHGNSDAKNGIYTVDKNVVTHKSYQNCDFWQGVGDIVPNYGKMN
jgi:Carboxylesterase family